jgi:hypothetical protein
MVEKAVLTYCSVNKVVNINPKKLLRIAHHICKIAKSRYHLCISDLAQAVIFLDVKDFLSVILFQ